MHWTVIIRFDQNNRINIINCGHRHKSYYRALLCAAIIRRKSDSDEGLSIEIKNMGKQND